MDPFCLAKFTDPVLDFYKAGKYFESFNPVFEQPILKSIQSGHGNIHCGVLILALALNAVFGTLPSMSKRLNPNPELNDTRDVGLQLRKFVAWDCTQFPPLLDTCLLMSPKFSPILNRSQAVRASQWWVEMPYHNIADCLAIKYGSIFIPVFMRGGQFCEQGTIHYFGGKRHGNKNVAGGPFFFKSDTLLVKVNCIGLIGHRLSGDSVAAKRAANAFQEACATQFACDLNQWFCEIFGLICVGLVCPCAFVCIVRTLGTAAKSVVESEVGNFFHDLSSLPLSSRGTSLPSAPLHMLHGDPHRGNMVLVESKVQLIDFDRTYLIIGDCPPLFLFTWYATSIAEKPWNHFHITALMRIMKQSGLDATHQYFSVFYKKNNFLQQHFNAELFRRSPATRWVYDAFLHLFQLIFEAGLGPKLISDDKIQCGPNVITVHAFDSPFRGNIKVSCADGSLQNVLLSCHSDTIAFFASFSEVTASPQPKSMNDDALNCVPQPLNELGMIILNSLTHPKFRWDGSAGCFVISGCLPDPVQLSGAAAVEYFDCELQVSNSGNESIIKNCTSDSKSQLADNFAKTFPMGYTTLRGEQDTRYFVDQLSCNFISMIDDFSEEDSPVYGTQQPNQDKVEHASKKRKMNTPAPPTKPPQPRSLPNHIYLIDKIQELGNQNVLESIQTSMMRRFGSAGSLSSVVIKNKKVVPLNALREEYFGCEIVMVNNDETRSRCIDFIRSQTFLSFDTESTSPRHNDEGISLIQIGTSTIVFIIQVTPMSNEFFESLGKSLCNTKTVLCWGNDEKALRRVVPHCRCTFEDVQMLYSTRTKLKSLSDSIAELFESKYVLNKSWTHSGWDNDPLTKGQLRYAALDVVCCHILYIAKKFGRDSVYDSDGSDITFFAYDISSANKVKHGFSFTYQFLGHFINGVVSRGFWSRTPSEKCKPSRFVALLDEKKVSTLDVSAFVKLLNTKQFCCRLCSSCCFFQGNVFCVELAHHKSFSLSKAMNAVALSISVKHVSDDAFEQLAYYCVSMLASFLQLFPSAKNLKSLKNSVISDIHYGYIRETLAHVQDERDS
jgi:hypothetical protein